jgi:hypothetical protein
MTLPAPAASSAAHTTAPGAASPVVRPPQSAFVTVLGWLMVAGSFMGALGSLAPLTASSVLLPMLMGDLPPDMQPPISPLAVLRVVAVISLVSSLYTLYASVALLNRKDWARRFFLAMFVLAIVCNLLFLVSLGLLMFGGALPAMGALAVAPGLGFMLGAIANFFFGWTVLATLLLWWWVHRLRSGAVRAEFQPTLAG